MPAPAAGLLAGPAAATSPRRVLVQEEHRAVVIGSRFGGGEADDGVPVKVRPLDHVVANDAGTVI